MLNLAAAKIWLCLEPTDMRKSFDTLAARVREHLGADPMSGSWFVFRGLRGDRLKILYWTGRATGLRCGKSAASRRSRLWGACAPNYASLQAKLCKPASQMVQACIPQRALARRLQKKVFAVDDCRNACKK
jgi:transposase